MKTSRTNKNAPCVVQYL